ncbi:MAG TPA: L-lactate permease [Nocardioidaceae bacterium]
MADFWTWLAAAAPVLVLFVLVASGKVAARTSSVLVALLAVLLAVTVFQAPGQVLGVALGKGLWLGAWILYVVFPAMLLYRLAERAGLARIGGLFEHLFPNQSENLLVLAWLLPSFVQGVAGFGTPIAVAAPLLVASGWSKERAVAYSLVGYHWSVTFGSMGSSYYMAALTAHLPAAAQTVFAHDASLLLAVNCLVAGALVLLADGGLKGMRAGTPLLLGAGIPMGLTLYAVTSVVPAVGSVSAGAVGFVCAFALARLRGRRASVEESRVPAAATARATYPGSGGAEGGGAASEGYGGQGGDSAPAGQVLSRRRALWLVSPYLYLIAVALAVLLVPQSRAWAATHLVLAPSFPATTTGRGWHTAAEAAYTPLHLLTHPGTYLLLACLLGYVTYRLTGLWQPRPAGELVKAWFASVKSSAVSILSLACVTTVMIQAGMVTRLARGVESATGWLYPLFAAAVGGVGSFLTGSTTSSNALFSSLQAEVADLLGVAQPVLLAAQTAGANVGNSLAPVVLLIGIGAVGGGVRMDRVLRKVLLPAAVLLATVTGLTMLLVTWHG